MMRQQSTDLEPRPRRVDSRRQPQAARRRKRVWPAGAIAFVVCVGLIAAVTAMLLLSNPLGGAASVDVAETRPPVSAAGAMSLPIETAPEDPSSGQVPPSPEPVPPAPEPVQPYTETVIGSSVQGRSISCVVFGSGDRKYLFVGGVHGDEWGAEAAEQFIDRLKVDPSLVPEGTQLHVIPSLNPDGRAAGTRGNANRVDLNRNMPASSWSRELDPRDSSATRNLTGGDAPGSEPESAAFINYMTAGFQHVISIHSQGGIVDWDGQGGETIAAAVSKEVGYPVQHLGYQAYIRGSMGAYVPEVWGIPIITVEMGKSGLSDSLMRGLLAATK